MKRFQLFLIAIFILFMGTSIGVGAFLLENNISHAAVVSPENPDNKDKLSTELALKIKEINDINSFFANESLSENDSYEEIDGVICYNYNWDNSDELIDRIKSTYRNSFVNAPYFRLIKTISPDEKTEDNIYVCLPKDCQVGEIEKYEIAEENENIIQVRINLKYMESMSKIDGEWKFDNPIIVCKDK